MKNPNKWALTARKRLTDLGLVTSNVNVELVYEYEAREMIHDLSLYVLERLPTLDREDETLP